MLPYPEKVAGSNPVESPLKKGICGAAVAHSKPFGLARRISFWSALTVGLTCIGCRRLSVRIRFASQPN